MNDLISRQAAISLAGDLQIHNDECHMYNQAINNYCAEIMTLPSAQPEPLTDREQRIFLSAMGREEKVCKQVDDKFRNCREPYEVVLVETCHEIIRKVKGVLWTN